MNFKIHRGTKEIGGSCVEIWTKTTKLVIDFGMPLVNKDGNEFNFNQYKKLSEHELINQGILPNINGLYHKNKNTVDGVLISHAHQDHYGLANFIQDDVTFYLGEATYKLLQLNTLFTPQNIELSNYSYFEKEKPFTIGDITITPYWADHSSFDAYSFLVESGGKSLFYSGDFRGHGRKNKYFEWFLKNAPKDVDYLLLEGTTISRSKTTFQSEEDIENKLITLFKKDSNKINLIYTSGQNIDRIVSIYRACLQSEKTLVVDLYIATVLKELATFANIPHPSAKYEKLKVYFPFRLTQKMFNENNDKIARQFAQYKYTKTDISEKASSIVMLVRPSLKDDLKRITRIDGGNFIYSMWEGYKSQKYTKEFIEYLETRNFTPYSIHTSGHADTPTLQRMVAAIAPKNIVPIHTFDAGQYQKIFDRTIVQLDDVQTVVV